MNRYPLLRRKGGLVGCCVAALAAVLTPAGPVLAEDVNWQAGIAEWSLPSVVQVLPQPGSRQRNIEEPEGSGVAIGDGSTIVTADHVLGGANRVLLRLNDGSVVEAEIVLRDAQTDLALLSVADPLPALRLAANIETGEEVCAAGNAFGLGVSIVCGVVSATGRRGVGFNLVEDFIQTDAAINPGMSGAPLLSREGEIAGIVSAIFTKGERDGSLGVAFVQSARLVSAFIADSGDGKLDRLRPGLAARPAPAPGETGTAGALVMQVRQGTPEAQAGIRTGDLLVRAGGLDLRSMADYVTALALAEADPHGNGRQVQVTYIRAGEVLSGVIRFPGAGN